MIILRLLLLLTNLHLKLLNTQGTGADKLLSTQRVNTNYLGLICWYLLFLYSIDYISSKVVCVLCNNLDKHCCSYMLMIN